MIPETKDAEDTWINAGDIAAQAVWDIANRVKDRCDEALDAMRVHNGMTLDEFLKKTSES